MHKSKQRDAYAFQIEQLLMSKRKEIADARNCKTSSSSSSSSESSTDTSSSESRSAQDRVKDKAHVNVAGKFTDTQQNCLEFVEGGRPIRIKCLPASRVCCCNLSSGESDKSEPTMRVAYHCTHSVGLLCKTGQNGAHSVRPPADLNALLSERGSLADHWSRVFSQDCITLDKSIWSHCSESLIRCLPSDSEHTVVFCKTRNQSIDESLQQESYVEFTTTLSDTAPNTAIDCLHGKSHAVVLQRLAWATRRDGDSTFYEDDLVLLLSPIASATQCRLQGCDRQTVLCTGIRKVIDVSGDTSVCNDPAISEDPVSTNLPFAAFSKWRADAKTSVVEIPDSVWLSYFESDASRLDEVPITNWWIVWCGSANDGRLIKQGAVVPATVMFDLLQVACQSSSVPTRLFLKRLSHELLDICCGLQSADIKCLLRSWNESGMLRYDDIRHAAISRVYASIETFAMELLKCRSGVGFASDGDLAAHHRNSIDVEYSASGTTASIIAELLNYLQACEDAPPDAACNFAVCKAPIASETLLATPLAPTMTVRNDSCVTTEQMQEFVSIAREIRDDNRQHHAEIMKTLQETALAAKDDAICRRDQNTKLLTALQSGLKVAKDAIDAMI